MGSPTLLTFNQPLHLPKPSLSSQLVFGIQTAWPQCTWRVGSLCALSLRSLSWGLGLEFISVSCFLPVSSFILNLTISSIFTISSMLQEATLHLLFIKVSWKSISIRKFHMYWLFVGRRCFIFYITRKLLGLRESAGNL